jgi:hypothetical protein
VCFLVENGTVLLVIGADLALRSWELATGKPIGEVSSDEQKFSFTALSRDGRRALARAADGSARIWKVYPSRPGAGLEADGAGTVRSLSLAERQARAEELKIQGGSPLP